MAGGYVAEPVGVVWARDGGSAAIRRASVVSAPLGSLMRDARNHRKNSLRG